LSAGMSGDIKTVRCIHCRSEFSDAEVEGHEHCPVCNVENMPMPIAQDVQIKINWHELRILCIWADNWARGVCDERARKDLSSIIRLLEDQRPDLGFPALTLKGELQEIIDDAGMGEAKLYYGEHMESIKPKPRN